MSFARLITTTLLGAALAGALAGCAPLVVGAAAGAALMVTDRRTSGIQIEDEGIELRAAARLREAFGDSAHVNVTSYNRLVLLTGEVPNEQAKQRAEEIVSRVENVRSIVNELGVMGVTTLTQRSADTLVTGKVKASIIDASDLQINAFKVLTERGTVYLMGRVTQREADKATQIARGVSGVQRVVRVFETISDEELKRLTAR
ncbi:BON domain-containing protein [Ramlibacter albus]|uniref:BON domain-containing protein n=1 Tax=Ramlibacter albus TaxID=2079448 RepID=A0A923M9P6_9BURK|nr:BON domain-containing protein [Ramlibacter albus]MBC5765077.1 BON domain-containing protein [Ramlibacter albus]